MTRIQELQDTAGNKKISTIIKRKEILSEIARGRLSDFAEAGAEGTFLYSGHNTLKSTTLDNIEGGTATCISTPFYLDLTKTTAR